MLEILCHRTAEDMTALNAAYKQASRRRCCWCSGGCTGWRLRHGRVVVALAASQRARLPGCCSAQSCTSLSARLPARPAPHPPPAACLLQMYGATLESDLKGDLAGDVEHLFVTLAKAGALATATTCAPSAPPCSPHPAPTAAPLPAPAQTRAPWPTRLLPRAGRAPGPRRRLAEGRRGQAVQGGRGRRRHQGAQRGGAAAARPPACPQGQPAGLCSAWQARTRPDPAPAQRPTHPAPTPAPAPAPAGAPLHRRAGHRLRGLPGPADRGVRAGGAQAQGRRCSRHAPSCLVRAATRALVS